MIASLRSGYLRIVGLSVLTALVARCADDRAPPPPPMPVAAVPSGPVAVDGTYQGTRQLVRGGDGPGILCGSMDPFSVTVTGRAFQYVLHQPEVPYQSTRAFNVIIDADGLFKAVDGPAYITGNASGGTIQGDISGDACGYVFQADRQ